MQNAQTIYLHTIEALLKESEVQKALDALFDLDKQTQAGIQDDLILQSGNFKQAHKAFQGGMISFEEYSRVSARTRYGLLELMKDIPKRIERDAKIRNLNTFQFQVPDEARLEKIIGPNNNLLKINWLEKALQASRAVCRVVREDGELGTGFLTREGYIFTNNHVLPSADHARTARVEFNYEVDAAGAAKSRKAYRLDASDFTGSPSNEFDFAKVRVIDNSEAPLSQWGYVEFDPDAIPTIGEPVTIIQHPKGQDKQIALNANEVVSVWNQYLFYTTDTEPGSSGAPVFNRDWKVVAIHHAGKTDAEGGLQINARGDRRGANRGILFDRIFQFIQQGGKSVPSGNPASGTESTNIHHPAPDTPTATPTPTPKPAHTPAAATNTPPKFVVVFDAADLPYFQTLNRHLFILKANKKIQLYQVHEVLGEGQLERAEAEMNNADYVLVLITSNIFNDENWYHLIIKGMEAGKRIIPVRITNYSIEGSGLEKLRSLPTMNRSVADFPNADAAYADIVAEIKKVLPA